MVVVDQKKKERKGSEPGAFMSVENFSQVGPSWGDKIREERIFHCFPRS